MIVGSRSFPLGFGLFCRGKLLVSGRATEKHGGYPYESSPVQFGRPRGSFQRFQFPKVRLTSMTDIGVSKNMGGYLKMDDEEVSISKSIL